MDYRLYNPQNFLRSIYSTCELNGVMKNQHKLRKLWLKLLLFWRHSFVCMTQIFLCCRKKVIVNEIFDSRKIPLGHPNKSSVKNQGHIWRHWSAKLAKKWKNEYFMGFIRHVGHTSCQTSHIDTLKPPLWTGSNFFPTAWTHNIGHTWLSTAMTEYLHLIFPYINLQIQIHTMITKPCTYSPISIRNRRDTSTKPTFLFCRLGTRKGLVSDHKAFLVHVQENNKMINRIWITMLFTNIPWTKKSMQEMRRRIKATLKLYQEIYNHQQSLELWQFQFFFSPSQKPTDGIPMTSNQVDSCATPKCCNPSHRRCQRGQQTSTPEKPPLEQ
ncbi:hypothetical protein VP01_1235g1 [Puccinia sorghi]|uniref:Uncharacterized protein n=1 Tax=Puccinia sorghi TaxID=27349 RepID=A0A0L6VPQ7_9BASI|nr:hypothetical protein VP01_1235g1 [Puccinia sorghi]